ncbi:DUF4358 domain-containing protein [Paenibacillus pinisoli]|uniref:DUF4358 domain-containing protein n=2 Tax=Paenibacillus pinisoli TaxID=1276110 RepID=A0A3A6PF67_9BACL|nr:DUF4358 domain-containing protein [Paenibacillus pinisoli]
MIVAMGVALTACSGNNTDKNVNAGNGSNTSQNGSNAGSNSGGETDPGDDANKGKEEGEDAGAGSAEADSAKGIVDAILNKVEQPAQMPLEGDMVKDQYHLDPSILQDYAIMTPLMNVKTNEVAVLKVKDAKDVAAVEEAVKKRAADVQKQFETYLPDQYENAKNFQVVKKGNYVLFVISESADAIVSEFDALVK